MDPSDAIMVCRNELQHLVEFICSCKVVQTNMDLATSFSSFVNRRDLESCISDDFGEPRCTCKNLHENKL